MKKLPIPRVATICIAAAILQFGCASPIVESKRYGSSQETVSRISFVQEGGADGVVRITKHQLGNQPTVSEADKQRVAKDFVTLNQVFLTGMRDSLPKIAAEHGLTVANPGQNSHTLKIVVFWREMLCEGTMSCRSYMRARGDIVDAQGNVLWYVITEMGQTSSLQPLSDDMFQSFARNIFAAMKRDGLIAVKKP